MIYRFKSIVSFFITYTIYLFNTTFRKKTSSVITITEEKTTSLLSPAHKYSMFLEKTGITTSVVISEAGAANFGIEALFEHLVFEPLSIISTHLFKEKEVVYIRIPWKYYMKYRKLMTQLTRSENPAPVCESENCKDFQTQGMFLSMYLNADLIVVPKIGL